MRNFEKYTTAQERAEAFNRFCISGTMSCDGCVLSEIHDENINQCRFAWLDLEAEEEKPLPCPFCGAEDTFVSDYVAVCKETYYRVMCEDCHYCSTVGKDKHEVVAAHNRVAKMCREVKE